MKCQIFQPAQNSSENGLHLETRTSMHTHCMRTYELIDVSVDHKQYQVFVACSIV